MVSVTHPKDITYAESYPAARQADPASAQDTSLLADSGEDEGFKHGSSEGKPSRRKLTAKLPYLTGYGWKTPAWIVGTYLLAIVFAAGHYSFFQALNREPVSRPLGLPLQQTHITFISLLFLTAFRATIVAVLSACFTQYMWYLLRVKPLRVDLLDDLFQARTNPFSLINHKFLLYAPLLFFIAAVSWVIPVATLYPPSSLTVENVQRNFTKYHDMSVMNLTVIGGTTSSNKQTLDEIIPISKTLADFDSEGYVGPKQELARLSTQVKTIGDIVPLSRPNGDNSSYSLTFHGPRLVCDHVTTNITIPAIPLNETYRGITNLTLIESGSWFQRDDTSTLVPEGMNSTFNKPVGFFIGNDQKFVVMEQASWLCRLHDTTYSATVSHSGGRQHVTYTTGHTAPFRFDIDYSGWNGTADSYIYAANSFALFDSMVRNLIITHDEFFRNISTTEDYENAPKIGAYTLPDGTQAELARMPASGGIPKFRGSSYACSFGNSVLNTEHYPFEGAMTTAFKFAQQQASILNITKPQGGVNISEDSLNELLFNITISALTLNTWSDKVEVTHTEYVLVYQFIAGLHFIIPYALCLALALVFVAMSLTVLHLNGVPASDGFLQVFMTTRGNTSMSRAVGKGCIGGRHNAPEELLSMKVRFGELDESASSQRELSKTELIRRVGFGSVEETVPLKRGVAYQ
ncbi:hypothetical protein M011DRAFT_465029 [Sporormia fimetaria CBS 119925]|uniref:Uncharacterized protein n=1 Tax=Sporormia fimetaria CBS 119925 TaxID=1340428 RepID=A0A6A6VL25_9PLEO|nr:hypothetical protein M011DRAFT_465029 [Sporormia fimetaria CBS 119925]